MKWADIRDKLFTKEEKDRTDALVRLAHDGVITPAEIDVIIDLSVKYPVIDKLLDEIAKQK